MLTWQPVIDIQANNVAPYNTRLRLRFLNFDNMVAPISALGTHTTESAARSMRDSTNLRITDTSSIGASVAKLLKKAQKIVITRVT